MELLNVKQLSELLDITESTIYGYTCNSGKDGGRKRQRFNPDVYRKLGRKKILFVKEKVLEHLENNTLLI